MLLQQSRSKLVTVMQADRTENFIQRIETALSRIAKAADEQLAAAPEPDNPSGSAQIPPSVSQLVVRHETLREEVAAQIRRIDDVVGKLEQ